MLEHVPVPDTPGSFSKAVLICVAMSSSPSPPIQRRGLAASGSGWDVVLDSLLPICIQLPPASNVEPSGFNFEAAFQKVSVAFLEL